MRRRRVTATEPARDATVSLQRSCDCGQHVLGGGACPACDARAALAPGPAASVDRALSAGGRPLDGPTRRDMESRFGRDFSRVRLHTDGAAAESAAAVGARAYTIGQDVVFGAGRYAPTTADGRTLLAHELAHTLQQRERAATARALPIGADDGAPEREAERAADAAIADRAQVKPRATPPAASGLLQRVPLVGAPVLQFVEDAISFFDGSAQFWAGAMIDQARFDRVITSLYRMVIEQERLIDRQLNGDDALRQRLRTAYIGAIRALMTTAATALNVPEPELYRRNSGRIPMWAWLTSHSTVAGISTPIAAGRTPAARTGVVSFASNGFQITIAPDRTSPSMRNRAETTVDLSWGRISARLGREGRRTVVTRITGPPTPTARIQTTYGRGVSATSTSGYGRGTTAADVAGGAVDPRSTELGFHEGTHGLDYVAFLESHAPPVFTGAVGDTAAEFRAALTQWRSDVRAYAEDIDRDSEVRTDCVGTTIDDFNRSRAGRGQRVTLACP